MFKPELNTLEVCNRLALSEGQKENKYGKERRKRKMANEKLTAKKVHTIVVCASLGSVAICLLYLGILFFSLPFTGNMTLSWILSLSITVGIILLSLGY